MISITFTVYAAYSLIHTHFRAMLIQLFKVQNSKIALWFYRISSFTSRATLSLHVYDRFGSQEIPLNPLN